MPRRRQPKFYYIKGLTFLTQAGIPSDLAALGWVFEGRKSAHRGAFGQASAFVETSIDYDWAGDDCLAWVGYSESPRRRLRARFPTPQEAMREVERAELRGPLATCWEGQDGTPQRDGWTHQVRQRRDVWYRLTIDNALLVVLQATVVGAWCDDMDYHGAIDGDFVVGHSGARRRSHHPDAAMEAIELEAVCRGHVLDEDRSTSRAVVETKELR